MFWLKSCLSVPFVRGNCHLRNPQQGINGKSRRAIQLHYLDGMVTMTLLETVFLMNDEWATEQHATAFSIKKHDDFLIETHRNCRKYAILHDSQSLDQKIGGYFDRRTISSGLKRSFAQCRAPEPADTPASSSKQAARAAPMGSRSLCMLCADDAEMTNQQVFYAQSEVAKQLYIQ